MSIYPLNRLQHLLMRLRSFCSIRYVVKFLPNGSSAPRLDIYNQVITRNSLQYDDCDCALTDSNVLYTSSCTDYDDYSEKEKELLLSPISAQMSNCIVKKYATPNQLSTSHSSAKFGNITQPHNVVPVYYLGSFSNVHTSSPSSQSRKNHNQMNVESSIQKKRNRGYHRKHIQGKRSEKYSKTTGGKLQIQILMNI
ncbi:unnamed protein product [Heterobilharzia americana]|nr:unnamed protein product [Heterobilharzia americana]